MQTARRLYVYLMAGIGLGVLVAGVSLLLTAALEAVGLGDPVVLSGVQATRERLTLAAAMTVVALPVWLIHWMLAERSVRPGRTDAELERSSTVRGLYFALVLGALLLAVATAVHALVQNGIQAALGTPATFGSGLADDVGLAVTAGAAWGYHLSIRLRDWGRGPITGGGAWLPRAYLYVAAFAGLFALLFGLADLLELVSQAITGASAQPTFDEGGRWWHVPLASAIASIAVGGATWLGHWWYAGQLWADGGHRGSMERPARLRFAYFVAVLVASAAASIAAAAQVGRLAIAAAMGVEDDLGFTGGGSGELIGSAIAAVLFAITWWAHRSWLRRAAAEPDVPAMVRADRLIAYPTALVGLVFGAVGTARLIALVVDLVLGGGRVIVGGDTSERVLAEFAPYALLGTGVWLWQWSAVRHAVALDPEGEAASTVRRAALLIALAGGVLAGIASLGVILYRLFGAAFGLDVPGSVVAELSLPIGTLIVATIVAAYHGRLLRRDLALREAVEPDEAAPAEAAIGAAAPELGLVLVGPPGTDASALSGIADGLREGLPDGYELRDDRRMS